jgi:competence protein ComEA
LLGVTLTLLVVHILGAIRWGTRPAELERGPAYRIDLNRANRSELLQVPGIGPALVERIEDYRRQKGSFQSVDELIEVRGIGPATLTRVRPWLCVEGSDPIDEPVMPIVKRSGKSAASTSTGGMDGDQRKTTSKKETNLTSSIDINRASASELQRLSGVGPEMSKRIIDERNKQPFKSVDDLRRVRGIGPKTLERLRPNITVGTTPAPVTETEATATTDER